MEHVRMSIKEWAKVQDNPIQRDTEKHAKKARHLRDPLGVHAIVFAGKLPNGQLVKLDGHTRSFLWQSGEVVPPSSVEVTIVPVADLEEARELYKTFDSKDAVETVPDKVSGGFRNIGFHPHSGLLQQGFIANAMRLCHAVARGFRHTQQAKVVGFDLYDAMKEFEVELVALDNLSLKPTQVTSGVVAAVILSYRKYGDKVLPFWSAVFNNGGNKIDGKMDGPQAIIEMILAKKTGGAHGGSAAAHTCARVLWAVEKWLKDELLSSMPRPLDLSEYLIGVSPLYKPRYRIVARV